EKLRAEYDEVNRSLSPMSAKATLEIIVGIASDSGIDIDESAGKLLIPPPPAISQVKVGEGNYQLLSFSINVQGDYDNVMAFISDLDSGKTLKTMVLKKVDTRPITVMFTGEEGARRAEFRNMASAVIAMMTDNGLLEIPNPMNFAGGVATNLMGDDPDTEETVEGFPDITTTAAEKGYSGNVTPNDGYVLYNHDKISTDNTTQFETVSYITMLTTTYYYTCEPDGTLRQFDGANVVTATEYLGSEESKIATVATLDVDIYTKPEE
ncbi:hypothetical protein KKA69_04605, partial [Patescibacteria group bacterium]|nr:hypothetical protein [Patescibacteria group bacterium]